MTTVLIVEDDPLNFRVFVKILTKVASLEVKGTENVDEVIQMVSQKEVDIILMDVSLSNSFYQGRAVDGVRIAQILKSDPATNWIPILLVTAHAIEGNAEHLLQKSQADGYISKPIMDYQQFVQQILQFMEK
jgi:hypothetical protein